MVGGGHTGTILRITRPKIGLKLNTIYHVKLESPNASPSSPDAHAGFGSRYECAGHARLHEVGETDGSQFDTEERAALTFKQPGDRRACGLDLCGRRLGPVVLPRPRAPC